MLSLAEIYFRNTYEVTLANNTTFTFSLQNYTKNTFFDQQFAIITAGNPNNITLSEEENSRRNEKLYSDLNSEVTLVAEGCYLDHCESGFLVHDISLDAALTLGRRYAQVAIFYNDTKRLKYIACNDKTVIVEKLL